MNRVGEDLEIIDEIAQDDALAEGRETGTRSRHPSAERRSGARRWCQAFTGVPMISRGDEDKGGTA
ncbi:hypothetical protein GCM10010405_27470 [Streptomyces macrosporus]|uniref:Uncharacterized protein n=1 Tax=Streptomyces macrosporus TaxID=44032 RepID=A0ABP5X291_9ACTN